ncbi:MAG: hypothetical protein IPF57_18740 [Gammaproteobacteria bacterium]|nr:hypothetical protein [Gammaproteobacteria bacterium]
MYDDPKHIRDHVVKVRLNEVEMRLLAALAEFNRVHLIATFARSLVIEQMTEQQKQGVIHDGLASDSAPRTGRSGGA